MGVVKRFKDLLGVSIGTIKIMWHGAMGQCSYFFRYVDSGTTN